MIRYPQAYIDYLVYFHGERDYFECHEVLEEYWKDTPDSPLRQAWMGLIQTAVALYHHRRGNTAGALKMLRSAVRNLSEKDLSELGIQADEFKRQLKECIAQLQNGGNAGYADIDIPLADPELIKLCKRHERYTAENWSQPSDLTDLALVDKHRLRDRSQVIRDRLVSREQKQLQKGMGTP